MDKQAPSTALTHLFTSPTNTTITNLTRILSTSTGIDTTLTLIGYTSSLISTHLHTLQTLEHRLLVHLLSTHIPSTLLIAPSSTIIARLPAPTSSPSLSRLASLSATFKALSSLCSDFRAFTRLWGLLGIYMSARKNFLDPPRDVVLRWTAWVQTLALGLYLFFENGYYLAGKGVLRGWSARRRGWWARVSLRCFLVYVGVEYVRLWRVWRVREGERREAGRMEGEKEEKVKMEDEVRAWKRGVLVNAAYTPVAMHWASGNGMLGDGVVGGLMTMVGWVKFRALWAQTA